MASSTLGVGGARVLSEQRRGGQLRGRLRKARYRNHILCPSWLSRSRNAQSKGISGSASTVSCRLLISRANRVIVASRFNLQAPKGFLASGVQGKTPEMQGRLAMVQRICNVERLAIRALGSIPHAERWNYA
jgi:hypothetical protein